MILKNQQNQIFKMEKTPLKETMKNSLKEKKTDKTKHVDKYLLVLDCNILQLSDSDQI